MAKKEAKVEEASISANGGNFDPLLEERKVKALEKIANSVDALTLWFEEIDKEEWGPRMEWYLSLWKDKYIVKNKIGIVVPYRNRREHLNHFIPSISNHLKKQKIPFEIIVVEQADDKPFNRGKLLNIGVEKQKS